MRCVSMLLIGISLAGAAFAETGVEMSADLASAYVFRGATFNDGPVLQPGLEVSGLPVTVGVWGNFDIDDYDGALEDGRFSEVDIYCSYDISITPDPLGLAIGYTEYTYPSGGDSDREVSLSLQVDSPLSPSAGLFLGVDGAIEDSVYIEVGLGQEMELTDEASVELGLAVGYLEPDEGESGLSHADLSVGFSFRMLSVGFTYVARIDDDALTDVEDGGGYDTELYGTVGMSHSF